MICLSELREKDVINVCDGKRIGYVYDISFDESCGKICSLTVYPGYFGFCHAKNAVTVPWENIKCIGEDTVLVTAPVCCPSCDEKGRKSFWGRFS